MQFYKNEEFVSTSLGYWTVCSQSVWITASGGYIALGWVLSFKLRDIQFEKSAAASIVKLMAFLRE